MNRYIIQRKKYFHEILNIQKKKKGEKIIIPLIYTVRHIDFS